MISVTFNQLRRVSIADQLATNCAISIGIDEIFLTCPYLEHIATYKLNIYIYINYINNFRIMLIDPSIIFIQFHIFLNRFGNSVRRLPIIYTNFE